MLYVREDGYSIFFFSKLTIKYENKGNMIYTDEQIASMTKEEAIEAWKTERVLYEAIIRKCEKLEELLTAVGIAYETYERSYKRKCYGYDGVG